MTREQIDAKLPWIINFSELSDVMDLPFKTYSSGMQARLTFATAICVEPEILVIDEALAAGDAYFVAKSFRLLREICSSGTTVLIVSHGTSHIAELCHKAIWIDGGKLRRFGPAREVTREYDYETHIRIGGGTGEVVDVGAEDA